jgi:hypothetical protein
MYGMPTRTRDLYGFKRSTVGQEEVGAHRPRTRSGGLRVRAWRSRAERQVVYRSIGFTGAMRASDSEERVVDPLGVAFAEPFWLIISQLQLLVPLEKPPDETLSTCAACDFNSKEYSAECREPLGFRTNFRHGIAADREAPLNRHRSMVAEAGVPSTKPIPSTNAKASVHSGRVYRINRGDADPDNAGLWRGFSAQKGEDRHKRRTRRSPLRVNGSTPNSQQIGCSALKTSRRSRAASEVDRIWLAAPKTTDLLSISPADCHPA